MRSREMAEIAESLAPAEKTMPYWEKEHVSEIHPVNVMAKCWEAENIRRLTLNYGLIPLDMILHECSERCRELSNGRSLPQHFFSGEAFNERDVRIVNATVRWLATNCGRGFLEEFFREIKQHS